MEKGVLKVVHNQTSTITHTESLINFEITFGLNLVYNWLPYTALATSNPGVPTRKKTHMDPQNSTQTRISSGLYGLVCRSRNS